MPHEQVTVPVTYNVEAGAESPVPRRASGAYGERSFRLGFNRRMSSNAHWADPAEAVSLKDVL